MGDRSLVQTPPPTMRGGVLEPLEPQGRDNCLSLQAVIVKNGKIFIDSIDALDDGTNDENKQLEEEIDRLTGGDDDDFMDNSRFSQEAFDSFMRANDSDDDIGDILIYNELQEQQLNGEIEFENQDYIKYEYHSRAPFDDVADMVSSNVHNGATYRVSDQDKVTLDSGCQTGADILGADGAALTSKLSGHHRRRDSLNLEEYSTFDEHVDRLLSEDLNTSWRYVPLYPENYYSCGQEVQRVSVISDLPNLLRDNNAECMRRVVPKVREVLHVADVDMQLAAATAFLQILERNLVSVDEYKKTFLQTILTSVDNKNEEVANAWLETLLSCIDLLPVEVVKKEILSIAVNKGQLCQTLQARLSCCKILGKVSSKFEHFVVKNDVLPVVLSLCGDVEYDVRACMCQRLDVVAHGLGLELTKSKLLPQLIELSEDESQSVICACLETTANIIGMLDREANVNAIIPMVKELLEKAMNNVETTLPVASRLFGQLCHGLSEYMTVEDRAYFQKYFKKLCKIGVPEKRNKEDTLKLDTVDMFETTSYMGIEARQNAAYNFPGMVLFIEAKLFQSELYPCFSQLCRDPHLVVRKTMAAGFHEVAKLLGIKVGIVFPELNSLLNSGDIEVLKVLIPNFQDIMSPLAALGFDQFTDSRDNEEQLEVHCQLQCMHWFPSIHCVDNYEVERLMAHAVQDVVTNFLRTESVVFSSPCWRTQEAMMKSMESLYQLCSNENIYNKVLPLLLDKLRTGRALPVKVAAAMTVTRLCRHLKYKAQREEVVFTLIDEFHQSSSCYQRSLFIDLAHCYLQVNSSQAFKDNFYEHVLSMKSDPVATVRLKMLTIFPDMKRSLTLPRDQNLRTALDTVLRQMIVYDKDKDVQHTAHQISEEMAAIQEGSDTLRASRRNLTAEEEEDLRKEDEENEILAKEEKERKDDETRANKGEKRNSIGGRKENQSKIPGTKKSTGSLKPSGGGSRGDGPHQTLSKQGSSTGSSANSTTIKVVSVGNDVSLPKQRILYLTKSKSTTCIPSLIPRLEQRPSTPPKKEPARRIPVLIASNKTASTPTLTGTASSKKSSSPTPSRKSQLSVSTSALSPGGVASTSRKSSLNNLSSANLARAGSVGIVSSPSSEAIKVKTLNAVTKSSSTVVGATTRVPKKATK